MSLTWKIALMTVGVFLTVAAIGCQGTDSPTPPTEAPTDLSLLALGDSYTVGHGVPGSANWPSQLADSLAASGDTLARTDVLAVTGWTTTDLLEAMGEASLEPRFGLVTVMIGVNNQFQGLDAGIFASELDSILGWADELGDAVLVFSIPDYGATPVGGMFGPEEIAREIDAYNHALGQVAGRHGLMPIDVTSISRTVADEEGLVARDGLHYSPEMYRRWVSLMLPAVRESLDLD